MTSEEIAAREAALEKFSEGFNTFAATYNEALTDIAPFTEDMFIVVKSSLNQMALHMNNFSPAVTEAKKKIKAMQTTGGYFGDGYFGKNPAG